MTDYITDRQLERMALGELDEAEAQQLLRELEERGEMERFEAIIADDEAFHESHPPAMLAAQIRAEVRRRARANNQQESEMIGSSRRPFALGFAAVAAALVLVAVFQLTQRGTDEVAPVVASVTTQSAAQTIAAAKTPVKEVAPPQPEEPEPARKQVALLDRGDEVPLPSTYYMAEGEIVEVAAKGISRIAISVTKYLNASAHEDRVYLEAKDEGKAVLTLVRKVDGEEEKRSALIVIGQRLPDDVLASLVEGDESLLACSDLTDGVVSMRIVAQYGMAFVGHAHMGGEPLDPKLRGCIESVVGKWEIAEHVQSVGENPGPVQLSVGTLRFNFGESAICGPNDDDC